MKRAVGDSQEIPASYLRPARPARNTFQPAGETGDGSIRRQRRRVIRAARLADLRLPAPDINSGERRTQEAGVEMKQVKPAAFKWL